MSKKALESYLRPMYDFLDTKTEEFRKEILNPRFHVIVLDNTTLKNAGLDLEDFKGFRAFAKNWAKKYANKANEYNLNNHNSQYIVVDDFKQAGSFFQRSKKERFLEGNSKVHRGHVYAAVREFGEHRLQETLGKLTTAAQQSGTSNAIITSLRRKMQAQLNLASPALRASYIRNVNKKTAEAEVEITLLIPELGKDNIGKAAESGLKKNYKKALNEFVSKHEKALINVAGSKSILEATEDVLDKVIAGEKNPKYKASTKTTIKRKGKKAKSLNSIAIPKLQDKKGQYTSLISLQNLLNSQITETVKQNMEKPALVNRTGRFAESVAVDRLTMSRQGRITAFYTYMKYPYQTFERGYKQGSARRDPRTLISKSIREIATQAVSNNFEIRTRRF